MSAAAAAEGVGAVLDPVPAAIIEQRSHVEQIAEERDSAVRRPNSRVGTADPRNTAVSPILIFARLDDAIAVGVAEGENGPVPDATQRVALHMPLDEPEGDRGHSFAQVIQIVLVQVSR